MPVKKWAQGQTYGINNDKAHLVLYRIYPENNEKTIRTRDQFGSRVQHIGRSVLLGVPSLKLDWKEV